MEALEILLQPSFWAAAIRIATPLIFGVLGALLCERAGVLNLGIEGIFVAGAMAGWLSVYLGLPLWGGVAVAALTGAAFGLLHAVLTVPLGLSQHVTGIGVTLLALDASGSTALLAAVCIGLAAGAELDVIAVLVTRYFGNIAYAENYGWQYASWTLGSGTAVIVTNRAYDVLGTHTPVLWLYVALFAISALLIMRLGSYPELPRVTRNP